MEKQLTNILSTLKSKKADNIRYMMYFVVPYADLTIVYFLLEISPFRSIFAHTPLQYCRINWIPGHSVISMD